MGGVYVPEALAAEMDEPREHAQLGSVRPLTSVAIVAAGRAQTLGARPNPGAQKLVADALARA
jgi:hypothetical protein